MTENGTAASNGPTLSNRQIATYALPRFGSAMMFVMTSLCLTKFYTDTLLLAPGLVAWTFLIGRLWDGVTDPIMGHITDATRSRFGRRRPYFLVSAIPVAIAFYFLWTPPEGLKDRDLFLYLTALYLIMYTFWTIFSIPHSALGAELTMDYHERTKLTAVREGFGVVGMLLGTQVPFLFIYRMGEREGYSYLAGILGATTAVLILICFFSVKENPKFQQSTPIAVKEGLKALFRNQPFRVLVLALVVALVGNAFLGSLTLYVAEYVIQMPKMAPVVLGCFMVTLAFSIVYWTRLSRRIGKKEAWTRSLMLTAVLFALSTYYHEGTWVVYVIISTLGGFTYGGTIALPASMMADVIDLDELQTGHRREGAYFGIWAFIDKAAVGIAVFIGMSALDFMGYVPNQEQSLRVFWTLKFLYCILPAICFAICAFILRSYPITQEEHARIRAAIEAKHAEETP